MLDSWIGSPLAVVAASESALASAISTGSGFRARFVPAGGAVGVEEGNVSGLGEYTGPLADGVGMPEGRSLQTGTEVGSG
jgi:hypothetical protein